MPYPCLLAWSISHLTIYHNDGSNTSQAFATHKFWLDSYPNWLGVFLPFIPALSCWLLPNNIGDMLSIQHLDALTKGGTPHKDV